MARKTEENMEIKKGYYETRIGYLIEMFKNHQVSLINENKDKIKILTSDYKLKFPDDAKLNYQLGVVETLILN